MKWFRFYSEFRHDTKMKRMPIAHRYAFVVLLCLANDSNSRGSILGLDDEDLAFELEMEVEDWKTLKAKFRCKGLIDFNADGSIFISNWSKRQFDSDSSAARVAKHRSKKKDQPCNVTETLLKQDVTRPDTDTDPDSNSDSDSKPDPEKKERESDRSFSPKADSAFQNSQSEPIETKAIEVEVLESGAKQSATDCGNNSAVEVSALAKSSRQGESSGFSPKKVNDWKLGEVYPIAECKVKRRYQLDELVFNSSLRSDLKMRFPGHEHPILCGLGLERLWIGEGFSDWHPDLIKAAMKRRSANQADAFSTGGAKKLISGILRRIEQGEGSGVADLEALVDEAIELATGDIGSIRITEGDRKQADMTATIQRAVARVRNVQSAPETAPRPEMVAVPFGMSYEEFKKTKGTSQ